MSLSSISQSTPMSVSTSARVTTRVNDLSTVKSAVRALSKGVLLRAQGLSPGLSSGLSTLSTALTGTAGQVSSDQGVSAGSPIQSTLTSYERNANAPSSPTARVGTLLDVSG